MFEVERGTSVVSTCSQVNHTTKAIWFNEMSLDELRKFAEWPDGTKGQILAWCHNRWKCGYYYEITAIDPSKDPFDLIPA